MSWGSLISGSTFARPHQSSVPLNLFSIPVAVFHADITNGPKGAYPYNTLEIFIRDLGPAPGWKYISLPSQEFGLSHFSKLSR